MMNARDDYPELDHITQGRGVMIIEDAEAQAAAALDEIDRLRNTTHPDADRAGGDDVDGWDCDDMLAWLRRRCSTIRIDPIRIHEVGYTLDCIDETEPMQPNRIMASVTAPTLHAALKMAIRSVDLLDEVRQRGADTDIEAREQEADALHWWRSQQ